METTLPKEILDRVDALARTLGTTTEMLFGRLVDDCTRLGMLELASAAAGLALAVIGGFAIRCAIKNAKVEGEEYDDYERPIVVIPMVGGCAAVFLGVFWCAAGISAAIGHLGAPTTYAMNQLRGLFS